MLNKRHIKKETKLRIVICVIAVLAVTAVTLVSAAAVTAHRSRSNTPTQTSDDAIFATFGNFIAEVDDQYDNIRMEEELQPQIEETVSEIKAYCGGEWSVYVSVPAAQKSLAMNVKKLQAASVIKLFVMGAVYDEYDELVKAYPNLDVDELIESMITISSNEDADLLVLMLGRGDAPSGRKKVNDFCKAKGFENTVMDRMMGDDNIVSDNYTTTEDSAKFLEMVINGEFKHSKDMLKYLEAQTRTLKIPDGVPDNVKTANKTGELEDVENDAAIIFAARPYILCVMADGVNDYQPPIDAIADISTETYNYLAPKLAAKDK